MASGERETKARNVTRSLAVVRVTHLILLLHHGPRCACRSRLHSSGVAEHRSQRSDGTVARSSKITTVLGFLETGTELVVPCPAGRP